VRRLTTLLRFLALIAALAGVAVVALSGPAAEATARFLALGKAGLTQPLFYLALIAAILLAWLARRLERADAFELSRPEMHQVEAAPLPLPPSPADVAAAAPLLRERDAAVRRLRLEALVRGQPDLPAFFDELLAGAFREGASDIHLQPGEAGTKISFRIRGELRPVVEIPSAQHADLVRRILVLANLPNQRPGEAREGRLRLQIDGQTRDLRLSTLPTRFGDNVVLRFGGDAGRYELSGLGFLAPELSRFEALLSEPQGLVLLCGPTGSGKTTTLYSALAHLHEKRGANVRIATLEDPIELELPFAAQTQVDRLRGLDFAAALRAVLRQDPNVLMIGEIRDAESAKIAVQAGLSGHLILTSLHADSSLGVAPRLIELGIEPFLVASATLGIVAQRQLDGLCGECRRPAEATPAQLSRARLPAGATIFRADGCNACQGKGRQGRRAIFEVLPLGEELRRLITRKADPATIEKVAAERGWRPLREVGIAAALAGEVSLDDVLEKLR
jgi:general secretion pathway protein E